MTPDELDFLAHTELVHYVSGEVIRYNLQHPGSRFHLATPERMPDLPALACGIIGPGDKRLVLTVAEWKGRPKEAAARAAVWMNK